MIRPTRSAAKLEALALQGFVLGISTAACLFEEQSVDEGTKKLYRLHAMQKVLASSQSGQNLRAILGIEFDSDYYAQLLSRMQSDPLEVMAAADGKARELQVLLAPVFSQSRRY